MAIPPIRAVTRADLGALRGVIDATGLFPSELLEDMAAGHLGGSAADEIWLTFDDGLPAAVAYCAPEPITQGTWNLLLVAVHPQRHGEGIGTALMRHVETLLEARNGRLLLIETSGSDSFARTRAFYRRIGYEEEARIREFYQAGEDMIVFRKALRPVGQVPRG
jgi:ribosomal protein S18 acetylase RimI-like enzyme